MPFLALLAPLWAQSNEECPQLSMEMLVERAGGSGEG